MKIYLSLLEKALRDGVLRATNDGINTKGQRGADSVCANYPGEDVKSEKVVMDVSTDAADGITASMGDLKECV